MERAEKNRRFILRFYKTLSGKVKSEKKLSKFTHDPQLISRLLFFEALFPTFQLIADEITCEENRVIVKARIKGKHTGTAENIPPTFRVVEMPFVIGYRVEDDRIIDHWYITDQMELLEQLGMTHPHPHEA
jgi:predicted ester cyclase